MVAQSRTERDEVHGEVVWYTLMAALSMGLLSALLMNWRIRQELRPLAALGQGVQHYDPLRPDTAPKAAPRPAPKAAPAPAPKAAPKAKTPAKVSTKPAAKAEVAPAVESAPSQA